MPFLEKQKKFFLLLNCHVTNISMRQLHFIIKFKNDTILEQKLKLESELVRNESMAVLKEFEAMDDFID